MALAILLKSITAMDLKPATVTWRPLQYTLAKESQSVHGLARLATQVVRPVRTFITRFGSMGVRLTPHVL